MTELTIVCLALVVALVAITRLWFLDRKRAEQIHAEHYAAWVRERRELLTRIQRPDLVPIPKAQTPAAPVRRTVDEIHKVGVVSPLRPGADDNGGDEGDGA